MIIAVEGINGSGKSTLCRLLAERFSQSVGFSKTYFQGQEVRGVDGDRILMLHQPGVFSLIRSAVADIHDTRVTLPMFFADRVAAYDIIVEWQKREAFPPLDGNGGFQVDANPHGANPIIIDRWHPTTFAYHLAHGGSVSDFFSALFYYDGAIHTKYGLNHARIEPDVVIWLTVDEAVRQERLYKRKRPADDPMGERDKRSLDAAFAQRINRGFETFFDSREYFNSVMGNRQGRCAVVPIHDDGSESPVQIADRAWSQILPRGVAVRLSPKRELLGVRFYSEPGSEGSVTG